MMGGRIIALASEWEHQPSRRLILITTVCLSVALDVATNIFNYVGAPSLIIPFGKGVVTIVVLASLRRITSYLSVGVFLFLFFARWLLILIQGQVPFLFDDSLLFFRILFFIAWLLLFDEIRDDQASFRWVRSIFLVVTSASFVGGVLGMLFDLDFFRAYDGQRAGFKGLFFGENDTSVLYAIALLYAWILFKGRSHRWYFVLALGGLGILGMGSKTAFLTVPLVPFLYWFYRDNTPLAKGTSIVWRKLKMASIWLVSVMLTCTLWAIIDVGALATMYIYPQFFTMMQDFGVVSALLSGRDLKVMAYLDSISGIPDLLFGSQIQRYLGSPVDGAFMVEIDIFDYLCRVGIVGVLLVMYLIYGASRGKQQRLSREGKALLTLVVILGATVGHTLLSGLSSMWIAFFIVLYSSGEVIAGSKKASFL